MPRKSIAFELDFMTKDIFPRFTVKQLDDVSLNIKPLNQGLNYDVAGATGKIFIGVNDDMFMQTTDITVSSDNISILLDKNILQKKGRAYAEIELADEAGVITSSSFIFDIDPKIGEGGAIPGEYEGFVEKYERLIAEFKSQINSSINNSNDLIDKAIKKCNTNVNDKLNEVDTFISVKDAFISNKINEIDELASGLDLHNHTNKTVLDEITSIKVDEWNNKSTFSGSYNDLTNKPPIPSLNGYATEEYVKNEIAKIDTSIDIVDSVEDMVDTNKLYVYSETNTWWRYKKVTTPAGSVLPNVDNAINWTSTEVLLNKRLNSSATEVDAPGCALFYFTFNDEMKNILKTVDPVWIRMKGCSVYVTSGNQTSTKVNGWSSTGAVLMGCSPYSQILMYEETKNGISSNPYSSGTFPYNDNKTAPVTAIKFGYSNKTISDNSTNEKGSYFASIVDGKFALSLIVNFASATAITEKDLENVYITFNEPIVSYEETTIEAWYDTGIVYNAGDSSTVVDLGIKVSELEDRVEDLEKRPVSGGNTSTTSTLPSYWKDRIDEISPKIESLQDEYGVDAFQFLWCSDIHSVPGSSPNNTTYLGEISRYVIDKHNIPFFAVSGDIMSQASHSSVEAIWTEYDKLNDMLSPIRNDEFLATKGNHDGAWGSPVDGVYYLNNVGTKKLFNTIYRRQTLDRNRVFGKDGTYFYVDCHNVRFYMLNAHTDGDGSENENGSAVYNPMKHFVFGNEQLNWIADTLLTVQEGQKVIFMAHPPTKYCLDGSVFEGILNSYKNRTNYVGTKDITGTYWGTDEKYSKVSVNKDFTNAKGDLVGYFHGHIHKDTISTDGQYPIISITTAGGDLRDDYLVNGTLTRVKGTPTETAIDLVTVTSDYVYLTRIGSGYDRKYNRATKEVTIDYDSAFDPSVSEDEEETPIKETWTKILSDIGYNDNTRYSTSPNTVLTAKTQAGIVAIEPISVTKGDVICIKGFTYPSEASKYSYLLVTDTNKTTIKSTDIYYDGPSDAQLFSFSLDNDLLTINITDSSVAYVAICTPVYSADLSKVIVTMNTDISST